MGHALRGRGGRPTAVLAATLATALLLGTGLLAPPAGTAAGAREHPRPCSAGLIALTFDDGPSATVTPRLVGILKGRKLPATFFMVGSRIRTAAKAGRLVQRSGFVIGNHTWSHPLLTDLSDRAVRDQLLATSQEMARQGITPSKLMRPPYGGINDRVRADVGRLGLVPVLWTVDSRDWAGGGPGEIAGRILAQLRPHHTNIVLQHDGVNNSPASVSAVPLVVDAARRRGYCFTDLDNAGHPRVPEPRVSAIVTNGSEAGPDPIRVLLMLDRPTTRTVGVRFRTVALSATPGLDYVPIALRLRFAPGTLRRWVKVRVLQDSEVEQTESLHLVLDAATGLMVPRRLALARITDDDEPAPAEEAALADGPLLRVGPFDPWS